MKPTAQQEAISAFGLEPLRVEAGAGTGKTTTLAWRVANLIEQRGVFPQAILGITFTNKASEELAVRIQIELDLPLSQAVEVNTYHGFAAELVQEFGPLLGIERSFSVITPTFGRQLLHELVSTRTLRELDLTFPRGIVARLIKLSSDMSDHLLTADDLIAECMEHRETPWPARAELARVVADYQADKRRLGVLDYGDLIGAAHRVVSEHPEVADRVRSRYQAVLLDEYQDTNPAQRELMRELFPDGFPVTAVGDPNQTIYEWRGATRDNFEAFPVHFPNPDGTPSESLPLSLNRRSDQRIVDVANDVAAKIGPASALRARPDAEPGHVEANWFRTAHEEAQALAQEVARLQAEQGIQWQEIAVLFRKNKDMSLVRDALTDHDVPVEVANLGGLLSVPEVVDLHAWLRVIREPRDGVALTRVLSGARYRLGLSDLRPLTEWARVQDRGHADEEWDSPSHSLIEAIEAIPQNEMRDEAGAALQDFLIAYRRLLADAQGVSLVELCRRILDAVSAWDEIEAMPEAARLSARLNLYRFLDLAEDWSPLEGRPSLTAFLDHLELMQEEEAEDLDAARLSNEDAVALLTVHRSKGLEWEVVFLPALYHGNFPSFARLHEDPYRFPQVLPYELRLDRESLPPLSDTMSEQVRKELLGIRHTDQEWRTAYVAVTRARSRLYASGAWWVGSPAPLKFPSRPSDLFDLISARSNVGEVSAKPASRPQWIRSTAVVAPDPVFPEGWQGALTSALTDPSWPADQAGQLGVTDLYEQERQQLFELVARASDPLEPVHVSDRVETSATGLVTYALCPRRYYWSEVDRLPRRSTAAARRGTSVHRQIELHNVGMIPFEDLDPDLYDHTVDETSGKASGDPFATFAESRFAETRPRWVEAPFELQLPNSSRVRGRIDAIYAGPEVVDFKTGRGPSRPEARVQMEAYGLAVAETGLAEPPLKLTFAYLGNGLTEESEQADQAWLTEARDHLTDLTDAIRDGEFEATPSQACGSCDFLRFCEPGKRWVEARS